MSAKDELIDLEPSEYVDLLVCAHTIHYPFFHGLF